MSDQMYDSLHAAFSKILLEAKSRQESPSDLVTCLIMFCARECAYGHADVAQELKFSKLGAAHVADSYGKAFALEMQKTLLKIDGMLN